MFSYVELSSPIFMEAMMMMQALRLVDDDTAIDNSTPTPTSLAQRLRARAAQMGYRPARLAERAGVSRSFIREILRQRSLNPNPDTLAKVAAVLRVDVDWLLSGHGRIESPADALAGEAPFVAIRFIKVAVSTDGKRTIQDALVGDEPYHFSKVWLRHSFGVSLDDLRLVNVVGDGMEPTLRNGDIVLIDLSRTAPTPPGIFVMFDGFGLAAKRLQYLSVGSSPVVRIFSDNSRYVAFDRPLDEVKIIGRVRWSGRHL